MTRSEAHLVSVIVPVYNGERFVGECLESIFAQDYRPFEAIVVDDGSTDRTADIVRSFPEVAYIHQGNQGPSVARNTGFAASKGEFISFFDHDDLMMPDKLSLQVGHLLRYPELDLVLGHQEVFCEPGAQIPSWVAADLQLLCSVIRRRVLDEVGGFDPEYRLAQDVEWTTRLLARGFKMRVFPDVVMRRRFHGSNSAYAHPGDERFLLKALKARLSEKRAAARGEDG